MFSLSCRRLRLRRGDTLAGSGQERVKAGISMQGLEMVIFLQVLDIVDRLHGIRVGPQVEEGLIPLAL